MMMTNAPAFWIKRSALAALALMLAPVLTACSGGAEETVTVSLIGRNNAAFAPVSSDMPWAARQIRNAAEQGLVTQDAEGRIVPALAERWIVTDDALSYIFRLRSARWRGGKDVTADQVAALLRTRIASANKGALAPDLKAIRDVRAMTGRVIEVRLNYTNANLLELLANAELSLGDAKRGGGTGPMVARRVGALYAMRMIPVDIGTDERQHRRIAESPTLLVRSEPAAMAIGRFNEGYADLVLGGRLEHLLLVDGSGLSRGTLRLDPVSGLFGLQVVNESGLLAEADLREAIAMAVNGPGMAELFNVTGWTEGPRLLPANLTGGVARQRWPDTDRSALLAVAAGRVANWTSARGTPAPLRIALPEGAGGRMMLVALKRDLRAIGLDAVAVTYGAPADLRLIDEIAPVDSPFWYFGQLSCVRQRLCSDSADALVQTARAAKAGEDRGGAIRNAEQALLDAGYYIPLGQPVRWSLVRGNVRGFEINARARHPLPELAVPTT